MAAYAVAVLPLAGAAASSAVATSGPALYVAPLAVSTNATASSVHIPDPSSPQLPQQPPPHTHPWPATPTAAEFALIMAVAAAAYVAVAAAFYYVDVRAWYARSARAASAAGGGGGLTGGFVRVLGDEPGDAPEGEVENDDDDDAAGGDAATAAYAYDTITLASWGTVASAILTTLAEVARWVLVARETESGALSNLAEAITLLSLSIMTVTCLGSTFAKTQDAPSLSAQTVLFAFLMFLPSAVDLAHIYVMYNGVPGRQTSPHAVALFWADAAVALLSATLGVSAHVRLLAEIWRDEDQLASKAGANEVTHEDGASSISLMTFSWLNPLISLGSKRALTAEDLWALKNSDLSANVRITFRKHRAAGWSLLASLMLSVLPLALFLWAIGLITAILQFSTPFFMNMILRWFELEDRVILQGLAFVLAMFACNVIKVVLEGQQYFLFRRVGIQLRSILVGEIYAKSLRRVAGVAPASSSVANEDSTEKKSETAADASTGKVVTIMSVDAERVRDFMSYSNRIVIKTPLATILAVSGLIYVMGVSALFGLAALLISVPIASFLGYLITKVQDDLMTSTDKRVNAVNEMLNDFAWENQFTEKITLLRKQELFNLLRLWGWYIGFGTVTYSAGLVAAFVTFASYTYVFGHSLDASTAFTALNLVNAVMEVFAMLPYDVSSALQAKVSIDRIAKFLEETELERFRTQHVPDPATSDVEVPEAGEKAKDPVIGFTDASFCYFSSNESSQAAPPPSRAEASSDATARDAADEESALLAPEGATAGPRFRLSNLNLAFKLSGLNVVCGPTGSGKSSLCLALLGEMKTIEGKALLGRASGGKLPTVAYVAQTAWLLNATIRDNIILGSEYDPVRYSQVVEACALVRDFQTLEGGDLTEIGEKGVNVSGGQKQRISLARAVYSNANIVILDDPLSAMDAPTARHLMNKAILGPLLAGRTTILVTHALPLALPSADYVAVMKDGTCVSSGSSAQVLADPIAAAIIGQEISAPQGGDAEEPAQPKAESGPGEPKGKAPEGSDKTDAAAAPSEALKVVSDAKGTQLVAKEDKATGSVSSAVYLAYFTAAGGVSFMVPFVLSFWLVLGVQFTSDFWLKLWTEKYSEVKATTGGANASAAAWDYGSNVYGLAYQLVVGSGYDGELALSGAATFPRLVSGRLAEVFNAAGLYTHSTAALVLGEEFDVLYYIGIYGLLGLLVIFVQSLSTLVFVIGSYFASMRLHLLLLRAILGAPLRFFEVTPIGRILNRISKDMSTVDQNVMQSVHMFLSKVFKGLCILGVVGFGSWPFLIVVLPVVWIAYRVGTLYLNASRELKRLESVSRSPIYSQEERFLLQNDAKTDFNGRAANRWLCLRTDMISAVVVLLAGVSVVLGGPSVTPGWAGLILLYATQLSDALQWIIRTHAEMEMSMNSVERCVEYSEVEQEPAAIVEGARPGDE
ncbi:hypothetical protein HK405_009435, partial [Cladochytrium tenue]